MKNLILILAIGLIITGAGIFISNHNKQKENHKKLRNLIEENYALYDEVGMLKYKKAVLLYSKKDSVLSALIDTDVIDSIYNAECKN